MAHLTSSALWLLGLLISSSFLGARSSRECARGWLKFERNCYAYFEKKMTWSEAEIDCQSFGVKAHLASVLSSLESDLLAKLIKTSKRYLHNVWIGLHDKDQKGKWRWVDGAFSPWEAWMPRQPHKKRQKNCVVLNKDTEWKQWSNRLCNGLYTYMCKYEI